ncbi:MAG: ribosome small subunit-dependent GTPase A [Clostridia bacterium]|nr:ribosome small subunit-dependent GTPase A [Clostridia bacterium]
MRGRITKGIAGFYYVYVPHHGMYECKAKGIFRKNHLKPLVGDLVEVTVLDETLKLGNMIEVYERKNQLLRPTVANVDYALLIFSLVSPQPNLNLIDRLMIRYEMQKLPILLCFSKCDLVSEEEQKILKNIYQNCGSQLFFISAKESIGIEELRAALDGYTTTVAGPSGVGKSTLINLLQEQVVMETGNISQKIDRGKHTTRHSELIYVDDRTYIMDTPGFSSLELPDMEKEELKQYYYEFEAFEPECRFRECQHMQEPDCAVKAALLEGKISKERYDNYSQLYEELKKRRRY